MSGARSYHAGFAAEEIVWKRYEDAGYTFLAHRWRGQGGELDLVFEDDATLVVVEVKAAATSDAAISSLSARQIGRISQAAEEFAGGTLRPIRIDLAAVNGQGRVEVIENITA